MNPDVGAAFDSTYFAASTGNESLSRDRDRRSGKGWSVGFAPQRGGAHQRQAGQHAQSVIDAKLITALAAINELSNST